MGLTTHINPPHFGSKWKFFMSNIYSLAFIIPPPKSFKCNDLRKKSFYSCLHTGPVHIHRAHVFTDMNTCVYVETECNQPCE